MVGHHQNHRIVKDEASRTPRHQIHEANSNKKPTGQSRWVSSIG
ncbi:hypothetical protein DNHGIG_12470 [Collibacillus ludicampi]|uniref:YpzG family protein n=1 Tax=Collibacillus ludicampi TaxID=2771369 RepID=A0AAV4LD55_9BACL|nr:hypothetical protein DNHGIG_12470 [Collibacillus ludicampi]